MWRHKTLIRSFWTLAHTRTPGTCENRLFCTITQNFSLSRAGRGPWEFAFLIGSGNTDVVSPGTTFWEWLHLWSRFFSKMDLGWYSCKDLAWLILLADAGEHFASIFWAEDVRSEMLRNSVSKLGCQEEFGFAKIRKEHKQKIRPKFWMQSPGSTKVQHHNSCSSNQFASHLAHDNGEKKHLSP